MLGTERSQLTGKRFGLFVAVSDRPAFATFLEEVFCSQARKACEVVLQKVGNTELFIQIEGLAVASGEECRIALIDITERKRAEEEIRQAKNAAEVLQQAKEVTEAIAKKKSRFIVNMSHELRTPLTLMLGFSEVLREEILGQLNPDQHGYVNDIISSGRHLLNLINDIIDMARIETRKLTFEDKPFSLRGVLSAEVVNFMPELHRKGIEFAISMEEEAPDSVVGDKQLLLKVITNLIDNAIKFTKDGRVEMHVSADGTNSDGKRAFTFTITDTGIGIGDDKKDLLFQLFSQIDDSLTRSYGGTGLGLYISKEIVELMGGTIGFKSKEGVGSAFFFTVPPGEAGL